MLKAEFDIIGELPWEKHPTIHGLKLHFTLVPADGPPRAVSASGAQES